MVILAETANRLALEVAGGSPGRAAGKNNRQYHGQTFETTSIQLIIHN
jgi:hypothetical protein